MNPRQAKFHWHCSGVMGQSYNIWILYVVDFIIRDIINPSGSQPLLVGGPLSIK